MVRSASVAWRIQTFAHQQRSLNSIVNSDVLFIVVKNSSFVSLGLKDTPDNDDHKPMTR